MPATKTARSLALTCPYCDEADAIKLNLNNLDACECANCDAEFSVSEAIERLTKQLEKWKSVAAWISAAPVD